MFRVGKKSLSLNAVEVFRVVGEHMNMSRAAETLSVTQSAVSHQVRGLEEQLGEALFLRSGRSIRFTPFGARLHRAAADSLGEMRREIEKAQARDIDDELVIAAPPTFTTLWLVPRFPELCERFPGVSISLRTMQYPVPGKLPDADIVVQFGTRYWPDRRVVPLVSTSYIPVCAPQWLQRRRDIVISDIGNETLIHDDNGEAWSSWLNAANAGELRAKNNIYVDKPIDALHLARQGVGLAVNDQIVTSHWLSTGDLIQAFDIVSPDYDSYYLVTPAEPEMTAAASQFEAWIRSLIGSRAMP